ncbi:hypothetical protein MNBD_BACTEROID05-942 [hydrothermal vent metagenome]|uniref:Thioredoxin domain-containing protein n=1 Tax=hydrothermal vent metagenome TaxID=652676 RepID=A0A3B0TA61_9ZZZZ
MKKIFQLFLVAFLIMVSYQPSKAMGQFFFMENSLVGEKAFETTLKRIDGSEISFSEYRNGKPALIFFWATWCPNCAKELKDLSANKEKILSQGISIIPVDLGEKPSIVQRYMKKRKLNLEMFLDEDSSLGESYDLIGVPTIIFVNKEGNITDIQHSLPENYEEVLAGK